jgi:hypothetical protein
MIVCAFAALKGQTFAPEHKAERHPTGGFHMGTMAKAGTIFIIPFLHLTRAKKHCKLFVFRYNAACFNFGVFRVTVILNS